ncbi:MAG: hypothetical protein K0R80_2721, partial [Clostridia bacterium]|nr:hypothetical protein [Clostridia bacterium]
MKKKIAKALALLLILSSAVVFSPATLQVDVVSAATGATPEPATPAPTPAAPAANAGQVYVIASGDMMWKIAQKHNLTLEQLLKLNPQITTPNR